MNPRIAIHERSGSFSDRWLEYGRALGLDVRPVNCRASAIMDQLRDADILLWHWTHVSPADLLVSRHILQAAEAMGLTVYPNIATCWHFDDKIAQKYLLESLGAPLVPTHVFYSRQDALEWIGQARFPTVFKLRRGASSANVQLVDTAGEARALVEKAFGRGFSPAGAFLGDAAVKWRRLRGGLSAWQAMKAIPGKLKARWSLKRNLPREKGYVYFQDYMPGNKFDTRVTVIGQRAFAFRRMVRENDFRASGSGRIDFSPQGIDASLLETAFVVSERMGAQSAAFDFIYDRQGSPAIVEVSYCFASEAICRCPGHWDRSLNWREGSCRAEDAILCDLLDEWRSRSGPAKSAGGHSAYPAAEPCAIGAAS